MILTPEEARRLHVLTLLAGKQISVGQAAEALGLTPRQVRRLRVALRRDGPTALTHGNRGRRPRRAQAGLLLQLDGSPFGWFGPAQPACSLLGAIDDATGAVLAATFRAQEDAAGYLELLRTLGRTVGLPAAVYTDSHGIFVRNDAHWTVAEELQGYQDLTQVGQALQALGIHHIVAESPQAKGRVERLWNTFQHRLVAELRLADITTMAAGNTFLVTTFLPAFNAQFAVPAAVATSAYRPVPRGWDLDRLCAFHYARHVAADNTGGWSRSSSNWRPARSGGATPGRGPMLCSASMAPGGSTSATA